MCIHETFGDVIATMPWNMLGSFRLCMGRMSHFLTVHRLHLWLNLQISLIRIYQHLKLCKVIEFAVSVIVHGYTFQWSRKVLGIGGGQSRVESREPASQVFSLRKLWLVHKIWQGECEAKNFMAVFIPS